jgi:peptide/nickel transport system ATP-binding protein/oligopeptide transport system ATP-binding protein
MITHDLGVIAEIAQRVVVMYAGQVAEEAPTRELFTNPSHPYTRGLLKSIPLLGKRLEVGRYRLQEIPGMVPSLYDLPAGCSFAPRCPERMEMCEKQPPGLTGLSPGHQVRCWLHGGG